MRDDGYDVTDYYGVNPRYGTLGDFVEFAHEAGSRGLRVLIDLVPNHSSDQHPWFRQARRRDSPFHDRYVWSKKRPTNWRSGVVFPAVQRSTWTYDNVAREYYFHRFYDFQPDLNVDNPRVREEIRRVMGLWLQLGSNGFRIDAVPFLIEKPPRGTGKQRLHFEYLKELRDFLRWRVGNAVLLGEANVTPDESQAYFAGGDGLRARPLAAALRATRKLPATAQWAHFLRNHDELDLGRCRPRSASLSSSGSRPGRRCGSTTAASDDASHRCSARP
jgi:maltose alpha-D-glucosyltransferase/alpha-amylase